MNRRCRNIVIVSIVALLTIPLLIARPAYAATSTYKDYVPSQNLVLDWGIGFGPFTLMTTRSEVSNLVVRAYSDQEVTVSGDISMDGGALMTYVIVGIMTAVSATIEITDFTWSNPLKWSSIRNTFLLGGIDMWTMWPGATFFTLGPPGSGHFEMNIKDINPSSPVFGVFVGVANAGSALGVLVDYYSIAEFTTYLPFQMADAVTTLIQGGVNVASLMLTPNIFLAADIWPIEPDVVPSPPPPPGGLEIKQPFVVYYDERYPTSWISRGEATAFRNYLAERGFVVLNADNLKTFMQNAGRNSVVIMAQDIVPDTVGDVRSSSAIIRQYLDRGGRVVWMEDVPFYYQGHVDGSSTVWGTAGEYDIIGVGEGTWDLDQSVQIKSEGVNRGLTQTWNGIRESDDATVTHVLADEDGYDAAAYVKDFNNGGEFIRIWDAGGDFTSDACLRDLITVATTGSLSWEIDMTAYNADSSIPRCADVYVNGYEKRIITWLNPREIVTNVVRVPGYWFTHELNTVCAWVTTYDQYDFGNSWVTVKLTSPEGFTIQYFKMKPANRDHRAYFEAESTGLWHVTNYRYRSAPVAIAFNQPSTHTYDTDSRVEGAFMFTLDLRLHGTSSEVTMEFYHCLWKENTVEDYDICRVQVSTDFGNTWTTLARWDGSDSDITDWTKVSLDISSFCGYNLQVRFHFDSVDSILNDYEGWYIDDIVVYFTQNDAGSGADAGDSFSQATQISPPRTFYGALYEINPSDQQDWYKFYAASGQRIYLKMTPPSNVNFDFKLYDPSGTLKAESHNERGTTDTIYFIATSSGYWRAETYVIDGEGEYRVYVDVYWGGGGGGGGCPGLFVWNGDHYVDSGIIEIHNETEDLTRETPIAADDVSIEGNIARLRLREGWPDIEFSESYIDLVELYAIDFNGKRHLCVLRSAVHFELGNVINELRQSDDTRVHMSFLETMDLEFLVPYKQIESFVFVIEGHNPLKLLV